ncbi:MAG: LemA family protein [Maricaulaceae bacterium]
MSISLIILIFLIFIVITVVLLYNRLVALRQMSENGWSDIEVQLKRRADLIPQIVATVKGYAAHEKSLFVDVIEKRNQAMGAGADTLARGAAESSLSAPVSKLMALAEDYPELKANENFLDLQNELSETEDKVEMARRFYNGAVRELNTKIQTVPSNLIAGPFGFRAREYFEISTSDAAIPAVDFS